MVEAQNWIRNFWWFLHFLKNFWRYSVFRVPYGPEGPIWCIVNLEHVHRCVHTSFRWSNLEGTLSLQYQKTQNRPFWALRRPRRDPKVKVRLEPDFFSCMELEDIHMYLHTKFRPYWLIYMVAAQKWMRFFDDFGPYQGSKDSSVFALGRLAPRHQVRRRPSEASKRRNL